MRWPTLPVCAIAPCPFRPNSSIGNSAPAVPTVAAAVSPMTCEPRDKRSTSSRTNTTPADNGDIVIIAIGLYPGFTGLDAIGPYEVLAYLDAELVICAEQTGVVDDHY